MSLFFLLTNSFAIFFVSAASVLFSQQASFDAKLCARRIEAHLLIGDELAAVQEAKRGLLACPDSIILQIGLVKSLAKAGFESECIAAWKLYSKSFVDEDQKNALIEEVAWGILKKESQSSSLSLRGMAMIGATLTQDVAGVEILKKNMCDKNSLIREIATELAAYLKDYPLKKEVLRLMEEDSVFDVRLAAIRSCGEMKLKSAEARLTQILSDSRSHLEERVLAAAAIVNIREMVQRSELVSLSTSKHAGLRLLACQLISKFDRVADLDLLIPLLNDSRMEVRIEALNAFGLLRADVLEKNAVIDLIAPRLTEGNYKVAITAAWVTTFYDPGKAEPFFNRWLNHPNQEVRVFAAAALASTGRHGENIAARALKNCQDPFVSVNLAIGLLGQRSEIELCCSELFNFLMMYQKPVMWSNDSNRLFNVFTKSNVRRSEANTETPEAADQIVRLELLRLLALMGYGKTDVAVKKFLKEKNWGISGLAATTLLEEGDEEAVEIVSALLEDNDRQIKIQAALALAMWAKDPVAVSLLQDVYATADRELKIKILEALGQVGTKKSIPFLIDALQDPFPMLRLIAASSLIICLNH